MQFNSYLFVLLFLPLSLLAYYGANRLSHKAGQLTLIAASVVYYCFAGWECVAILAVSVAVNYGLSLLIRRNRARARLFLTLGILFNIGLLFYFKYFNFFLSGLAALMGSSPVVKDIILPLGISFFSFQQISWLLEVRKEETCDYSLMEYAAYLLFFPKLVMGPLIEPDQFIPQLRNPELKTVNWENLASGIQLFILGLCKKLFFADAFVRLVDMGFKNVETASPPDVVLIAVAYTFQIYFDFSGFTDMAVGIGRMFNLTLPINFNSPYQALSVGDFWKRWHMTLTNFFTRHLYIPLGGSRRGTARTYLNILIVFLVSGIWHGANWTFILWGFLYGVLLVIDKAIHPKWERVPKWLRWVVTFSLINLLWLLFRADTVGQWLTLLRNLFDFSSLAVNKDLVWSLYIPELTLLRFVPFLGSIRGIEAWALLLLAILVVFFCKNTGERDDRPRPATPVLFAFLLFWCLTSLAEASTFVYFGF